MPSECTHRGHSRENLCLVALPSVCNGLQGHTDTAKWIKDVKSAKLYISTRWYEEKTICSFVLYLQMIAPSTPSLHAPDSGPFLPTQLAEYELTPKLFEQRNSLMSPVRSY
jgi:hypothetical protein